MPFSWPAGFYNQDCAQTQKVFLKTSYFFIFVMFTLRKAAVRYSSTLLSLIYYKRPWNDWVRHVLLVYKRQHSFASLSEKSHVAVNILMLAAHGTISGILPFPFFPLSFPFPFFLLIPVTLTIPWSDSVTLKFPCKGNDLKPCVWERVNRSLVELKVLGTQLLNP